MVSRRALIVCALALLAIGNGEAQVQNYIVGPQDILSISLFDQPDLGGKYAVEADGTFTFPLVGRVKAGGLTLRAVEQELERLLSDGFFKKPQVSVAVEQYRSQRVFVVGEVRSPGAYPLTGDMTLIEALARAGSTTDGAGNEALIVRVRPGHRVDGPVLPDQSAGSDNQAEVIQIDIRALQTGRLSQNAQLRDNDTIFIPPAPLIYISGQVRNPGSYPLQKGMTVLQALSLAGGATDRGATNRITVRRVPTSGDVDAKPMTDLRVQLNDLVQAGDTLIVPERFF